MQQDDHENPTAPEERPARRPAIARACFHLNWIFLLCWGLYSLGPDLTGLVVASRDGWLYRIFGISFFLIHFVLISTGIIALFVVIIEVYARRPVRGFRSVLTALGLPIASFLYFAVRYLVEVERWLERWK
jgi:hypothetical protein